MLAGVIAVAELHLGGVPGVVGHAPVGALRRLALYTGLDAERRLVLTRVRVRGRITDRDDSDRRGGDLLGLLVHRVLHLERLQQLAKAVIVRVEAHPVTRLSLT